MLEDSPVPAATDRRRPAVAALAVLGLLAALLVGLPQVAVAAVVSVNDAASVVEGNDLVFEVTRDTDTGTEIFDWEVTGGNAEDEDVAALSGSFTIGAGQSGGSFSVPTVDDDIDEFPETVQVSVTSRNGGPPETATGLINDDDVVELTVSTTESTIVEGADAVLTVTMSSPTEKAPGAPTVEILRTIGSASAADFATATTTLTLPNDGVTTTASVLIATTQDDADEPDETFSVMLGTSTAGATVGTPDAVSFTIADDDPLPLLSIADVATDEGDDVTFTLTLTGATERTTSVRWATSDATATAGSDYTASDGTATFPAGTTTVTLTVPVASDTAAEPAETFTLDLTDPVLLTLDRAAATATINDQGANVPVPVIAISPTGDVDEGTTVELDGTGSTGDPTLTHRWTLPDGGTVDAATTSFVASDDGLATIVLQVTDGDGDSATEQADITVNNVAPVLTVAGDEGGIVSVGPRTNRFFTATTSDVGADTVTVTWTFGDGSDPVVDTTGPDGAEETFQANHSWAELGLFTVTVTADDGDGGVTTHTFQANVRDEGSISRSFGSDRIATAVAVALDHFGTAETVLLARADDFPDALAAAALARAFDAPILLTTGSVLAPETISAILSLGATRVILLGGTTALPKSIGAAVAEIDGVTEVDRVSGLDRFKTAAKIALRVGAPASGEALIVLGSASEGRDAWPDALSAGAFRGEIPILLTRGSSVPQETIDALEALGITSVTIIGGTAAISETVENFLREDLGLTVDRLGGANRYETSALVAAASIARFGPDGEIVFATGGDFPDGLTASALGAHLRAVVVLVHPTDLNLTMAVRTFLRANSADLNVGIVAGGPNAVAETVLGQARSDIDG